MALVGLEGQWLDVNQALCELVGYSEEELRELTFQDLTHPDDLDADLALVADVLAGRRSTYQMNKRYIHADGRVIWALLSVSLATDEDGRPLHFISQIQDVTERRELEEKLRHQAEHDPLTGLANRRRFEQELERQIERCARHGERAALAVIDLDRFKAVNDVHGHATGDKLLAAVGDRAARAPARDRRRRPHRRRRVRRDPDRRRRARRGDRRRRRRRRDRRARARRRAAGDRERRRRDDRARRAAPTTCSSRADRAMYDAKRAAAARAGPRRLSRQTPRGAESASASAIRSRIERIPTTASPSMTGMCR